MLGEFILSPIQAFCQYTESCIFGWNIFLKKYTTKVLQNIKGCTFPQKNNFFSPNSFKFFPICGNHNTAAPGDLKVLHGFIRRTCRSYR
jgi:hypothetical protein